MSWFRPVLVALCVLFGTLTVKAWTPGFFFSARGGMGGFGGGGRFNHRGGGEGGDGGSEGQNKWVPNGGHQMEEEGAADREAPPKDGQDCYLLHHTIPTVRGGSSKVLQKGSKNTLSTTASFWSKAFQSAQENFSNAVETTRSGVTGMFKSKAQKEEEALLKQLKTTPIKAVTAPNSTVLPPDVLALAAQRSGLIGRPLRVEAVQEVARNLKQWYTRKGYVLHSVTGATLQPDSATAELTVQEPRLSSRPVGITFCKEMVVDDDGSLVTYRQYREKHRRRQTLGHEKITKADLNTTFVQTTGRTDPQRLATALKLHPGRPFCWDGRRWQAIAGSGIFGRILKASPEPTRDGAVQLHILATEAPPRNLEYGITKSLYTGAWEGEVDFEHNNLFGGGESVGLVVRRGAKDAEPSIKLQYSDDKFGLEKGYDVEVFSDFIGETDDQLLDESNDPKLAKQQDGGDLLDRRGASVRFRNPFDPKFIRHSSASACLERTSTLSGHREAVASASVGVGPFTKDLPLDARSNILAKITTGTRVAEASKAEDTSGTGYRVKPYSTATATTRQVFPLAEGPAKRSILLALQHSLTASTFNLPRHEANALGHGATLRGYSTNANGAISTSLAGTTEIRIPVNLPTDKFRQDASIVIFGDWLFAKNKPNSPLFRKSSIGVGLRKTLQGIPVKYDVSYTGDGKVGASFGLGRDFDA